MFSDRNLNSLSLPGLVGVLLARVAKTVFITGTVALHLYCFMSFCSLKVFLIVFSKQGFEEMSF